MDGRQSIKRRIALHLRITIVTGVLILVPIVITYFLLQWVFNFLDGIMQPAVRRTIRLIFGSGEGIPETIPGLGLITLGIIVYALGLVWTKRLGRRLIRTIQHYLVNIPIIGTVYGPARKLIESFSGDSVSGFKRVVIVEYPKKDTWMIGFLTGITEVVPGTTMGIVYLPTAPTPNSGWVALVPTTEVYDTDLTVQEAMSMVLSGGIAAPLRIDLKPLDVREVEMFLSQAGAPPPQSGSDSGVFQLPFTRRGESE